jgi:hypothetical protein
MVYAPTSYNRTVYASAQKRLGLHSARSPKGSHASFRQIGGGGLASQALICRRQLRKQPERYATIFEIIGRIDKNNNKRYISQKE